MLAPFFDKAPSLLKQPDGSILFECLCNANPQPTIKWHGLFPPFFDSNNWDNVLNYRSFKDKELTGDKYVMKIKKTVGKWTITMQLKNPCQADQGVYKVTAINDRGTHSVEQQYVHCQTANEIFKTQ